MTHIATTCHLGVIAFALCSVAAAQNEPPTFRTTTRLVEFTVVALDKKGNPVADLRREDFTILDNGKTQEVAFFRYEGSPEPEVARATLPAGVFTNRIEGPGPVRNITAVLIDSLNTEPRDQVAVKAQAMQFLRELAPQSRVALYQLGTELRVLHDYTDDMNALRAQLGRIEVGVQVQQPTNIEKMVRDVEEFLDQMAAAKSPYRIVDVLRYEEKMKQVAAGEVNYNTAVRGNRVETTLASLESLARHISGVPGRKTVVWISGGLSMNSAVGPSDGRSPRRLNPAATQGFQRVVRRTAERLAQLGITLYAVDAHGLTSSAADLAERQYPPAIPGPFRELERAEAYNMDNRAVFDLMTSTTGGRFFFNTNDFSEGVRRAAADMRGAYSIAFYSTAPANSGWRTLSARINRPAIQLAYRKGYSPAAQDAQEWSEDRLREAISGALGSSGLRFTARCRRIGDGSEVELSLQIETGDVHFHEEEGTTRGELEVHLGEHLANGDIRFREDAIRMRFTPEQYQHALTVGLPYHRVWHPDPSALSIRVLVRDRNSGAFGTIDIPASRIVARS